MLLINCYVGQKVQSLLQHQWFHSLPCFQTADLNFTATFTLEGWFCIIREIALHLCYGPPCNAKRCNMYMYVSVHVYIYIGVITCWTPQPCSWREAEYSLIQRFPLSLGTDLMPTIFGNNISTLKRRGGKDIGTSQASVFVCFISKDKHTELHWKQANKLINNLDQKLADQVPFSPCCYYFKDKVLWSLEEKQASNVWFWWYWCEDRMKFYILSSSIRFQVFFLPCPSIFTFFESTATASTCYQLFIKILSFFCSNFWL